MEIETYTVNGSGFERHNIFTKILCLISVPVINNIPNKLLKKMAGASSHDAFRILNSVGSTHALEVMYNRHERHLFSRGILQGMADFFWHHVISQLKAVRNRLKIVETSLEKEVEERIRKNQKVINILTIGGGSCRAIIHSVSRLLKKYPEAKILVTNIDKDSKAIELGKKIADVFNVSKCFNWIHESAFNTKNLVQKNSFDIAEMVGLLDYFDYEKGREVLTQIYISLKESGLLIVANVYPNREMKFVEKVGWPKMHYRTKDDFVKLIKDSGFSKLKIFFEPLKIHIVGVTKK